MEQGASRDLTASPIQERPRRLWRIASYTCSNHWMGEQVPDCWTDAEHCDNGHPWGPGRCSQPNSGAKATLPARPGPAAPGTGSSPAGHRGAHGRTTTRRTTRHPPLGMRERPVPASCWRGRQAPGRLPVHAGPPASAAARWPLLAERACAGRADRVKIAAFEPSLVAYAGGGRVQPSMPIQAPEKSRLPPS